ncbi:MAG: hypothetical protein ACRD1D_02370 [Acidimicrobiales bacterium]
MRLTLGSRTHDLTHRALVLGVPGSARELLELGADMVEPDRPGPWGALPVYATAVDEPALEQALAAHAVLVRLPAPTAASLRRSAGSAVAVLVPAGTVDEARAAGLAPDRIVPDSLLLDVTEAPCPVAATAVGVIRGARIVRTADVRGARRICDVLAAVLEAG